MSQTVMDWDLSSFFAEYGGPQMAAFKQELSRDLGALRERASQLGTLDDDNAASWEDIFLQYEGLLARLSHLEAYVDCLTAADAHNQDYSREQSAFALAVAEREKLDVELARALRDATPEVFDGFAARAELADASHFLGRRRKDARQTMAPEKEVLAAELGVDGLHAWGRLYDSVSSKLTFEMVWPDGRREMRPMSDRRGLQSDADRRVRQAAFAGGNQAWRQVADVAAAALNGISGTRLTLNRHRGVDHFLDIALSQSAITRKTLDALFSATFDKIELPRRILRLKAKLQGTKGVAWYDLSAPLPLPDSESLSWQSAKELVASSFSRAYPKLGAFSRSMYESSWIDWRPRAGKRPGAFCTESLMSGEQRVYLTYNDTLQDVRTLAHEVGHAFHGHLMRDLRPYSRIYPMTLAESASTFGEMLLSEGILADPQVTAAQKARILDMEVGHGAIFLMDIPVRYLFEKKLYERRGAGELSVGDLDQLMVETQREVFGDTLEEGGEDPLFWASKLHFYITQVTFYNFPYTFGFLLSRGLFAMFKEQGPDFLPRYEAFLRLTGSDTAEGVARRTLGRDLEDPGFWADAIATLEAPLSQFEALLPEVMPEPEA